MVDTDCEFEHDVVVLVGYIAVQVAVYNVEFTLR